ncbi:Imm63 family immunity protein [Blastomonas sp. UPD001]|jgi:hypothetical protein|uniref:Imm63 family immunity protein n=1 Tax=Blastomonas sp. UPD001 TaxID=2217673 RepID=UPI000E34A001|nr:Imm63 family immunity protein [Blastomonas sp. UPD001]
MADPGGGMEWREIIYVVMGIVAIFCLVAPVVLIARLPRRAGVVVAMLWFFAPVAIYWAAISVESMLAPQADANDMTNAWAGFHLLSGVLTLPWLVMWSGGIVLALVLKKQSMPRSDHGQASSSAAPSQSTTAQPQAKELPDATRHLHETIRTRAAEFGIEQRVLPIVYFPDNDAAYVSVTDHGYSMARYDRGNAYEVSVPHSLDEILYWVFDEATFRLAGEQAARELTHADQFGPLVLEHQGRLLAAIHADWHARWQVDRSRRAAYYRDRPTR